MTGPMPAAAPSPAGSPWPVTPGVRLTDVPGATLEERIGRAGELGFSCVQLPSKLVYASFGIDRSGLTPGLARHLAAVMARAGVWAAVLGCYRNLALTEDEGLGNELAEFRSCARFASWLGGCVVATECGRPNRENAIGPDRLGAAAMDRLCHGLEGALDACAASGVTLAVEPGFNECACSAERCRVLLDRLGGRGLAVVWDPVSLLHPSAVRHAPELFGRFIELCGDAVAVLHMKDLEVVPDEARPEWCDGTGRRIVCHGIGETGGVDLSPVLEWASKAKPWVPAIVENGSPEGLAGCLSRLRG